MKTRVHYFDSAFIDPTNPLDVAIIGAGGTGSQVLMCLARMNHSLIELGHPGLSVKLVDPDRVSRANLGRQLFAASEVGQYKAVALINRVNRFFGTAWKATPCLFQSSPIAADIYISCLDNVSSRVDLSNAFRNRTNNVVRNYSRVRHGYWMDFGNSKDSGQVLLSTVNDIQQPKSNKYTPVAKLPTIMEEFGELLQQSEDDDQTPSCSLAEALDKQDLFINSTIAQMGCSLLWSLFREGFTENRGFYLNLRNFKSTAIRV